MTDMRVRLSTLWVFAVFNYLYADVITLMDPAILTQIMTGRVGPVQLTPSFLLVAAILIETAIVMVVLSRVLRYRANRWVNIIIGALHTAAVALSLFIGGTTPALYYMFFGTIEIACTLLIIWYAWSWKPAAATAA